MRLWDPWPAIVHSQRLAPPITPNNFFGSRPPGLLLDQHQNSPPTHYGAEARLEHVDFHAPWGPRLPSPLLLSLLSLLMSRPASLDSRAAATPEAIHIIHCWHHESTTPIRRSSRNPARACLPREPLVPTASSHSHPGRTMTSMTGSCKSPEQGAEGSAHKGTPIGVTGVAYPQNATVQAGDEDGTGHRTALSHRRPCKSHDNGWLQVCAWNVVYDGTCDWMGDRLQQ